MTSAPFTAHWTHYHHDERSDDNLMGIIIVVWRSPASYLILFRTLLRLPCSSKACKGIQDRKGMLFVFPFHVRKHRNELVISDRSKLFESNQKYVQKGELFGWYVKRLTRA